LVKWGRWVAVLVCTGVLLTTSAFHPGAEPRTIHGRMHWRQSTITVPAGSSRILVVHATGIHHTAAMRQAPWSRGLLVANSGSTGSQTVYLTRG
jgi:hypothetical protein